MSSEMMDVKKQMYKFYKNNITQGKLSTYNHFKVKNVPKTTFYHIIKRYESGVQKTQKF